MEDIKDIENEIDNNNSNDDDSNNIDNDNYPQNRDIEEIDDNSPNLNINFETERIRNQLNDLENEPEVIQAKPVAPENAPRNNRKNWGRSGEIKKATFNTRENGKTFEVNVKSDEVNIDEDYFAEEIVNDINPKEDEIRLSNNSLPEENELNNNSNPQSERPSSMSNRSAAGPAANDDLEFDHYMKGAISGEDYRIQNNIKVEKPKPAVINNPEQAIDNIINNLEPNRERLANDINQRIDNNRREIKKIYSTEEYKAFTKELMGSLKQNLDYKNLSEIEDRYKRDVNRTFATDELSVLLFNGENYNEDSHIKMLRKKILGKEDASAEEYEDVLTKFAKYNQMQKDAHFDSKDPANREAFSEFTRAVCIASHVIHQKGLDIREVTSLAPNERRIKMDAKFIAQKNQLEYEAEYVETNDIPDNIIESTEAHLKIIFDRASIDDLTDAQLRSYKAATEDGSTNIDIEDYNQAIKILDGNPINTHNITPVFQMLSKLSKMATLYAKHKPAHPNINNLNTAVLNVKDLLSKKGLTLEQIETLTNLSDENVTEVNPEFDKQANSIIHSISVKQTAATPIKDALDKFYTELAVTFDAGSNKYGTDLTTESFVSAAKTFKKMTELQDAYNQMNSIQKLDEIGRHIAKVEKFLELKGFTEKEIKAIKSPDIYKEDSIGLDGFQKLADRHWDMYANKENEPTIEKNNNINPIVNNINPVENNINNPSRTPIEVSTGEPTPTIFDQEPFDEVKEFFATKTAKAPEQEIVQDENNIVNTNV